MLAFRQAPGRLAPDTKLDLAVAPARFLSRALHMWHPEAAFGYVANQAVGYLFPMGPFFAAGAALPLPAWVVQRGWTATLLVVAFVGAVKVMEALEVGRSTARVVAAAAYALSPTVLVLLGETSGGQVPAVLLPWVLLPLIRGATRGSPRRAAAGSGLAVVAMGAANAAATVAVLPLPLLWLVTRRPGPRRRRLVGWWLVAVLLGTLWWAVALLLQRRYALDFLPFTEQAATTTSTVSSFEVLRGMGHWLAYFFTTGPWLPAGWSLASSQVAIGATAGLTAAGLYGAARRDAPERVFLILAILFGAVCLGAAYSGPVGGGASGALQELLDGPLGAFRNVAKFGPVLRLPLAVGLAHAIGRASLPSTRPIRLAVAALLVVAAALPVVRGQLAPPGTFDRIPEQWHDAATWLERQGGAGRTLVVPAASFGEYTWGRPLDEPLQVLADKRPWAVRDLIPLGSVGATRLLDAVEERLVRGEPSPGLAVFLARAGVRFVLVRHDLDPFRVAAPPPIQIRHALASSPGVRLVATFGPPTLPGVTADREVPDLGRSARDQGFETLEIYRVEQPVARAVAYPAADALVVSGGPETLLGLADAGRLAGRATVLAGDKGSGPLGAPVRVVTDSPVRRDVHFGSVRDNRSYALTATEPAPDTGARPRDRLVLPGLRHQAVERLSGVRGLAASTYGPGLVRVPEQQPYAAFDGDPASAWVATPYAGSSGQWIEVTLDRPRRVPSLTLQLLHDHSWRTRVTRIRIDTDGGSVTRALRDTESPQTLRLTAGTTSRIRITLVGVEGASGAGIREITIPGVRVDRRLAVPDDAVGQADLFLLGRAHTDPYDATRNDEEPGLHRRLSTTGRTRTMTVAGTAIPRPGPDLDAVLASPDGALVTTVSSRWEGLPAFGASQLVDGDPATAWMAGTDDPVPTIELRWSEPRSVGQITVVPADGPVLRPTRLRLLSPAGERDVRLSDSGPTAFPLLTTDRMSLAVVETDATPVGAARGLITPPSVGIAELHVAELADLEAAAPRRGAPVELPCGEGPLLQLDGQSVPTRAIASRGELIDLRPVPFEACEGVALRPGAHRVDGPPTGALVATIVALDGGRPVATPGGRDVSVDSWGAEQRELRLAPGGRAVLALTENFNGGWRATLDGVRLAPVRVDGWRQGWRVPAGAGGAVEVRFGPDVAYRRGLVLGALALAALVVLAVLPPRGRHMRDRSRRYRPPPAPTSGWALPGWAVVVVAGGAAFLLGGPMVLAVPVLAFALWQRPHWLPSAAALCYLAAGTIAVVHPGRLPGSDSGAFGPGAQAFAVLALVLVALSLVPRPQPADSSQGGGGLG